MELSQTRDEETGRWAFAGNRRKEEAEGEGTREGGGKQLRCPTPPSFSSLVDDISGEFALVVNGHSLVHKPSM